MSERCAAPHCGRSMSEGSGREPYDFCDLQFCDRDCARRWAHDEVLELRASAALAAVYRGGLHRILSRTKRNTRGYRLALETLNTATGKRT